MKEEEKRILREAIGILAKYAVGCVAVFDISKDKEIATYVKQMRRAIKIMTKMI